MPPSLPDTTPVPGVAPLPGDPLPWWRWVLVALAVVLASAGGGALLGRAVRQDRLERLRRDVAAAMAADPAGLAAALPELNRRRAGLAERPEARFRMSQIYLHAASILPPRRAYLDHALREADAVGRLLAGAEPETELAFHVAMQRAVLLMEIGGQANEREALRELQRAGTLLEALPDGAGDRWRDDWKNALAYLLASAGDAAVRDPERGLELIREVIAVFPNSEQPAYLDTLAEAYFGTRQPALALAVQRQALALAEPRGLEVYLEHYDAYHAAARADVEAGGGTTAPSGERAGEDF